MITITLGFKNPMVSKVSQPILLAIYLSLTESPIRMAFFLKLKSGLFLSKIYS
jgi:hypothetical protein